jgi:predicted anti-sigma-YlaC factor YlaD
MKDTCSAISKLLERYFDQEATEKERSLVEQHLPRCPTCSEALRSMGNLQDLIKIPVEEAIQKEDFQWVWQKIRRGLETGERPAWRETLLPRVDLHFLFRRRVWIPAVATVVVLLFITAQIIFKKTPSYPDASVVEYVESESNNVMVYDLEKAKVTVIWLFEESAKEHITT